MKCPICKNDKRFSYATCLECGYNINRNEFEQIKVYVNEVPAIDREYLIERHMKYSFKE